MTTTEKARGFIDRYGLPEYLLNPVVLLLLEFKIEVLEGVNTRIGKLPNLTKTAANLKELLDVPTNDSYVYDKPENIV